MRSISPQCGRFPPQKSVLVKCGRFRPHSAEQCGSHSSRAPPSCLETPLKGIPYEVSFLQGHSDRSESPDFVEIEFFSLGVWAKKPPTILACTTEKNTFWNKLKDREATWRGDRALKVTKWLGSTWTGSFVAALARLSSPVSSIHVRLMRMLAVCTTTLLAVGHLLAGGGFLAPRLGAG
jgi:hypothetical protein